MFHTSYIELSKSALQQNISFLKQFVGPDTTISGVVKSNAYGHGIEQFVPLAQECGLNDFSVFSAGEAYRVHSVSGDKCGIIVMGEILPEELEWLIEHDISFYVFEIERLREALLAAEKVGRPAHIHLLVETGMNRLGLTEQELKQAIAQISDSQEHLQLEGVCTHYAGAESVANYLRVHKQIEAFRDIKSHLTAQGIKPRYWHSACSAATLNYPQTHDDLVRVGISLYGFWPTEETRVLFLTEKSKQGLKRFRDPLKQVISWKSRVMAVKQVPQGQFVGYGTSYLATRSRVIALVPVGYYDGYSRNLSNLGRVLINGKRAGVIGMVNMNMMTIDITDIPGVQRGDEVVLIGQQKRLRLTVTSFSDLANHLNYEILTRLPAEIPRVVVK